MIRNLLKMAADFFVDFYHSLMQNLWVPFVVIVAFICAAFFLYYIRLTHVPREKKKRVPKVLKEPAEIPKNIELLPEPETPEPDRDVRETPPENWLELELLGLTELDLKEGAGKSGEQPEITNQDEPVRVRERKTEKAFHRPHHLTIRDLPVMLLITAVYAAVAFWGLGSGDTPQSFARFENENNTAVIGLPDDVYPETLMYFTGLGTGWYDISFSADNETFSHAIEIEQKYSELFKWQRVQMPPESEYTGGEVKFIKIEAKNSPLFLGELVVFDGDGVRVNTFSVGENAKPLLDETGRPVIDTSYLYNAYFDEIYHARTAYEHILGIYPYEVSHPPLGKLTIAAGVKLFGMNPFGWRFMGTLFGVLMLPLMYIFIKNLFGKTIVAMCGTVLFAFDFMHFVQTRIATIDTYGVFFIILMFYFMYRYLTQDYDEPLQNTLLPLFFSGLFFGIGAASKWTVVYGGAGLLIIYVMRQILRGRYYFKVGQKTKFAGHLAGTLGASVLFFIVVPVVIYVLSYIPYGVASGIKLSPLMLVNPDFLKIVWENQEFMFGYHKDLVATHPYSSPWWMWVLNLRPILYYLQSFEDGTKSAFAAFGNPIVWWTGIGAVISMVIAVVRRKDKLALFILIGYLVQLIPWIVIPRIAFIYHYFPSVVFVVLAISYMFNDIYDRKRGKKCLSVPLMTTASVVLFAVFYPVLTGAAVNEYYTSTFLRWFQGMWPF